MTTVLALAGGLIVGLVLAAAVLRTWETRRAARLLNAWRDSEAQALADASLRHSETVLRGQITEQVAPLLPGFSWDPADARFLGKPIDYAVFAGYSEVRSGQRRWLREVVFVDIKTGRSELSKSERRVKACVEEGAVRCVVLSKGSPVPSRSAVGRGSEGQAPP